MVLGAGGWCHAAVAHRHPGHVALQDQDPVGLALELLGPASSSSANSGLRRSRDELLGQIRQRLLRLHDEGREPVRLALTHVLERVLALVREERVDHPALGRRKDQSLDHPLLLDAPEVRADELEARARDARRNTRVLAVLVRYSRTTSPRRATNRGEVSPVDQHHVAEPAHGRVRRPVHAERRDGAVLEQDVVHDEREVPVSRRPVVRLPRLDDDVAVQPHLLGVVLAHVRVVPVHAGVGEAQPVGEVPPGRPGPACRRGAHRGARRRRGSRAAGRASARWCRGRARSRTRTATSEPCAPGASGPGTEPL